MSDEGLTIPAAALLAAVGFGAAAQGGFYRNSMIVLIGLTFIAAAAAFHGAKAPVHALEISLLGLGAWAMIAGLSAGAPDAAISTTAVCGSAAATIACMRRIAFPERRILLDGFAVIGALVALSGLVGVALQREPFALPSQGLWRAATSLTYANAAGCLLAMAALAGLALALERPSPRVTVALTLTLAGLGATVSRGAIIAFVVGLSVFLFLHRDLTPLGALLGPTAGAVVAVTGLLPSMLEGRAAAPAIAFVSIAVGVGLALLVGRLDRRIAFSLIGLLVAGVVVLSLGTPAVDRLVEKRLTFDSPVRIEEARAALRVVEARPILGAGPGRAPLVWKDPRTERVLVAEFAHNEYLQIMADTGVVGGCLALAVIAFAVGEVRRGRASVVGRAGRAAVAGALTVFLVQSAVDFTWHVPVLPVLAAALVGMCVPFGREEEEAQGEEAA